MLEVLDVINRISKVNSRISDNIEDVSLIPYLSMETDVNSGWNIHVGFVLLDQEMDDTYLSHDKVHTSEGFIEEIVLQLRNIAKSLSAAADAILEGKE